MRNIKITLLSLVIPLIFSGLLSLVKPAQALTAAECEAGELPGCNTLINPTICYPTQGDYAACQGNKARNSEPAGSSSATAGSSSASGASAPAGTKVELFKDLGSPQDPRAIIGTIIKGVLGVVGSVALVLFIFGGVEVMLSRGDSGEIKKGYDTMLWAAIGLVVIFASYAITNYVIENISKPSV